MSDKKTSSFGMSQQTQYIVLSVLAAVFIGVMIYRAIPAAAHIAEASQGSVAYAVTTLEEVQRIAYQSYRHPQKPQAVLPQNPFSMPNELREMLRQKSTEQPLEQTEIDEGPDPDIIRIANSLTLRGIIGSGAGRIASINGRNVRRGDIIAGLTVFEVNERDVVVGHANTKIKIKLYRSHNEEEPEDVPLQLPPRR